MILKELLLEEFCLDGHGVVKMLTDAFLLFLTVQKHGLKVYMKDPHAFTPMLEEGVKGQPPRSLLLGNNLAENQKEIGKFSKKDAKVYTELFIMY